MAGQATWLIRSSNGGDSWELASNTDYSRWQGWFSHDVAVHPDSSGQVIAVGIDIWKSTSAGASLVQKSDWTAWYFGQTQPGEPEGPPWYSHADHHDVVYHPTNRDIVYFANDGGVFRSLDGGETFESCNGGFQTTQFYAGFSSSQLDPNHAIGGMQDNSTAIFDGTDAWIRVIGGDGSWTAINPINDDNLYGSAQYLNLFRSDDRGNEWVGISPPSNSTTGFIAPFALGGPADPSLLYAGRSVIWKSTNAGRDWSTTNFGFELDGNPTLALAVSQTNSNVAYATTAPVFSRAGVFRTLDGNQWTNITADLPDRYPVGLAIDPTDHFTVYVAFSGFGTSHLFKSTDSGDNWLDIGAGLPDVPTLSVLVDPLYPDHLYVGNDLGVYVSTDGGGTWFDFSRGLPDAVTAMDLTYSPVNRMLRLSTYGNGVYEHEPLADLVNVPAQSPVAAVFRLDPNRPNPFNPNTTISYELFQEAAVELTLFDPAGRKIRDLFSGIQSPGVHSLRWDGRDGSGRALPSGNYLLRLRAGGRVETRKLLMIK
jgi:hypothetical protein